MQTAHTAHQQQRLQGMLLELLMLHQRGRPEALCNRRDADFAVHTAHRCVCLSQVGLHHLDACLSCCKALSDLLVAGSCIARSRILKQG